MAQSYFFYDLETSGFRSGLDRIMQFAGQRTNEHFEPIGEPYNVMVKLASDILPQPSAILFTGLSLEENKKRGISEPEFAKLFNDTIAASGTIFIGFNNLRFDDEFIRYLNYRNFYDAYSWHWSLNRSRWDLLDAVRMTRALRPDGIKWPMDEGKPSNRLELLTKTNKLLHLKAHDALSDVQATIEVAKLIATNQPKLFNYLINLRSKSASNKIINGGSPFIYTTGRYSIDWLQTSIVLTMDFDQSTSTAQVYDLRTDPIPLMELSVDELVERWQYNESKPIEDLPLKTIKLNRCPAVAPLSVLDDKSIKRLKLDMNRVEQNRQFLMSNKAGFDIKLKKVIGKLNENRDKRQRQSRPFADLKLYDKFISSADQKLFPSARQLVPISDLKFSEKRLNDLYLMYLARNFSDKLTPAEETRWRELTHERLFSGDEDSLFNRFINDLKELRSTKPKSKLIKELEDLGRTIADGYGKP